MQTVRKSMRPVMLIILALIIIISMFLPIFSQVASAEGESTGVSSLSLYDRASEVARTFGSALAPGGGISLAMMQAGGDSNEALQAGNAGGFLGYADYMSDDTGVTGWFSSAFTQSSDMFTYEQMATIIPGTTGEGIFAGGNNPFFQYAGYGELLTEMGLVGTIREGSMGNAGRAIVTFVALVAYLLANAAPFLFSIAITMLDILNPFKLFFTAFEGMGNSNLGILAGVANFVGGLYETIRDFSIYALFPLLLVITVVGALVFTKTSALKRFARYGLRLFMLFAGLPLIGATYTGVVEDLGKEVQTGAKYADYLVMSTYVDFENWAKNTRLAVPESVTPLQNPRNTNEGIPTQIASRDLVLAINGPLAGHSSATALKSSYGGDGLGDVFRNTRGRSDSASSYSTFAPALGLLTRHMGSAGYSGAEYAGEVSGQVQGMRDISLEAEVDEDAEMSAEEIAILKMFTLTGSENRTWSQRISGENSDWAKAIDWDDGAGLFTAGAAADETFQFEGYPYNIYNSGSLTASSVGVYSNGTTPPDMSADNATPLAPIGASSDVRGGLSPLSMYNFLNTTFTDTGMTIVSPSETVVDTARDTYASVTFATTGVVSFMRWIENVVVMVSMAMLSISYGWIMITAAVKNIPRILSGVFGTALGSIAFTAKLLISTLVMIIQILGMMLLYFLSEMILMSIIMNMNNFTATLSEALGTSGMIIEFARGLITTVIIVALTMFMIKNVNIFKEMMEEVVTNGINKFMSLLDTSTGGQGLSVGDTSGGRVGGDGKLTQDAKDNSGTDPITGVGNLMKQAHDIEAQREQMAQENGMGNRGVLDSLKGRASTFGDLAGAKAKDTAKRPFTKDPKSFQREVDAKERSVRQAGLKNTGEVDKDGKPINPYAGQHGFNKDTEPLSKRMKGAVKGAPGAMSDRVSGAKDKMAAAMGLSGAGAENLNAKGQQIDENGNVIKDAQGNALDADGKPISSMSRPGVTSGAFGADSVNTDSNTGAILDENGNMYTDENGQGFYQDEDGNLVDENGAYLGLDSDGTLQPIESLPDYDGQPQDAAEAALSLDAARNDSSMYSEMQALHDASHYGMDAEGNAVDANGNALTYTDSEGNEQPVELDDDGFITDNLGNRLDQSEVNGIVDGRGFDMVTDPDTGDEHYQHVGDEAAKAHGNTSNEDSSLDGLAAESVKANALADEAEANVAKLTEQGAAPYAIAQAQRHADKARANATAADNKYNKAAVNGSAKASTKPVTKRQVDAADKASKAQQATLQQEENKLKSLKSTGASPQAIARQERKVDAQRSATTKASDMAADMAKANNANRPLSDVTEARERVDRAEAVLDKALSHQADGQAQGVSAAEMSKRDAAVAKASNLVSKAKDNQSRMSEAPAGSREEIDSATATHTKAQEAQRQAEAKVKALEDKAKPMPQQQVDQLQKQQAAAQSTMQSTRKAANAHVSAQQEFKAAASDVASHQSTVNKLTRRGASPDKIQAATTKLNAAKSRQSEARQTMSKTSEKATAYKQAAVQNKAVSKQLSQAGRPMTAEQAATVKQSQTTAQRSMQANKDGFDRYTRGQTSHKQARRAANAAKRDVDKLTKQNASPEIIEQAQEKHSRAVEKVKQAEQVKSQNAPSATAYKQASQTYQQTSRQLNNAQPTVSEKEINQARREVKQAAQQVKRTSQQRQRVTSPAGWKAPNRETSSSRIPESSNDKGYANLVSQGVNNYSDYRTKATSYQNDIQDAKQRMRRSQQQLKQMKASKRPASEVRAVESQIKQMREKATTNQAALDGLQSNAHGLLRRMSFNVPGVTNGNAAQSGAVLSNQMEVTGHVMQMRSRLQAKRNAGTATREDNAQFTKLTSQMTNMKDTLIRTGIDPSVFESEGSLEAATNRVRDSWSTLVDGKMDESASAKTGRDTNNSARSRGTGRNNSGRSRQ